MAYFRQSKRRVALFCETVLSAPCSPGLAIKLQNQAATALEPCSRRTDRSIAGSVGRALTRPARSRGVTAERWIWAFVAAHFTLFAVRLTRSADVVRELLGEAFGGAMYDRAQDVLVFGHQATGCWAHLVRDFQGLIDSGRPGGETDRPTS